jgi:hypothetical protein
MLDTARYKEKIRILTLQLDEYGENPVKSELENLLRQIYEELKATRAEGSVSPDVDDHVKAAMNLLSRADIARANTERRLDTISNALADALELLRSLINEVDEREAQVRLRASCRHWVCEFTDILIDSVSQSTSMRFESYGGVSRAMRRECIDRQSLSTAPAPVTSAVIQFLRRCDMSLHDFNSVLHLSDVSFYSLRATKHFNGAAAQALLHELQTFSEAAQLEKWVDPMKHVVRVELYNYSKYTVILPRYTA